ncbi:hypothetical protein BCR44DRAFT_1429740, partial [Catenaria anguillulae PL171]
MTGQPPTTQGPPNAHLYQTRPRRLSRRHFISGNKFYMANSLWRRWRRKELHDTTTTAARSIAS